MKSFPASGKSVMRAWTPWEVLVIRKYYCNMSAHWAENLIRLFHGLYKSLDKLISWCLTMPEREKLRNYHAAKQNSIGHLSCFFVVFFSVVPGLKTQMKWVLFSVLSHCFSHWNRMYWVVLTALSLLCSIANTLHFHLMTLEEGSFLFEKIFHWIKIHIKFILMFRSAWYLMWPQWHGLKVTHVQFYFQS